jgi:DNA-binding PadR family transcriptional regulator
VAAQGAAADEARNRHPWKSDQRNGDELMAKPNLTFPTGLVLQAVARGCRYGFDIIDATGLPSGTVYPALRRLEAAGCLSSEWEERETADAEGRPPRCYYGITGAGEALLEEAVARFPAIRWTVVGEASPEAGRA